MAKFDYASYKKKEATQNSDKKDFKVGFFGLKDDGDEATVRFVYDSTDQFHIATVHSVEIDGKPRRISCLRTGYEPLSKCPLCESGDRVYDKMYVKVLQYTADKDGHVTHQAKIWERPAYFGKTLETYFKEYANNGPLSDVIFKIKRHGKKGDTKTTYDIMFANPMIYKDDIYVKDFSAFDGFDIGKYFYYDKTADEMKEFLATGKFPERAKTVTEKIASAVPTPTEVIKTQTGTPIQTTPIAVAQPVVTPTVTTNTAPAQQQAQTETDPTSSRPRRYSY